MWEELRLQENDALTDGDKELFLHVCYRSLLKTLREREKLANILLF